MEEGALGPRPVYERRVVSREDIMVVVDVKKRKE